LAVLLTRPPTEIDPFPALIFVTQADDGSVYVGCR
jgi:hypothetical protein